MQVQFEGYDCPAYGPGDSANYLVMLYAMGRIAGVIQPTGECWYRFYWTKGQAICDALSLGILPNSETTPQRLKPREDGVTALAGGVVDTKVALRYFTPHPLQQPS